MDTVCSLEDQPAKWLIGMEGDRESGKSMVSSGFDDDDDDEDLALNNTANQHNCDVPNTSNMFIESDFFVFYLQAQGNGHTEIQGSRAEAAYWSTLKWVVQLRKMLTCRYLSPDNCFSFWCHLWWRTALSFSEVFRLLFTKILSFRKN